MTGPSERRHETRFHIAITIELRDAHGFSLHASRDISVGGAFFDLSIPNKAGSRVQVSFNLPGDPRPISCAGEVVNVPKKSLGMGVHFLDMSREDQERLEAFTRSVKEEP